MPNPNLPINARYNTYIGARYVPKFAEPTEWSAQNKYDPLTIVTYQGNSYTSKTFVPVGVDINNSTYWAETGNYNAQVEQYRQEVLSLLDKTQIAYFNSKKLILLGDSYCTETYGGNCFEAFTQFNLFDPQNIVSRAENSIGFVNVGQYGNTFLTLLQSINVSDPEEITDIIVIGGLNDANKSASDILLAFSQFISYCESTFTNAIVSLAVPQSNYNSASNRFNLLNNFISTVSGYNAGNYRYLSGCENSLHEKSDFAFEGLYHPSPTGYQKIKSNLINSYFGNTGKLSMQKALSGTVASGITFTPSDIYVWLSTYFTTIYNQSNVYMEFNPGVNVNNNNYEINVLTNIGVLLTGNFQIPIHINTNGHSYAGYLSFKNNGMYLTFQDFSITASNAFTMTYAYISPFNATIPFVNL